MSLHPELTPQLHVIIKAFKLALKRYFSISQTKRAPQIISYYEEAKKAETSERHLVRALELYTKAIQNGEKKDSSIKDFASSLHQLGYTKEAVRLMEDCEPYYEGNKEKYLRLRDNLQIQFNPTGKHLCRYILVENVSEDIKRLGCEEQVKTALFKSPKRIKKLYFLQDFSLADPTQVCPIGLAANILIEFESFSAAKKTLETFFFDEWFASDLYWVNGATMRIACIASDGKKDFEEGFVIDDGFIQNYINSGKEQFWTVFAKKVYKNRQSNGFINLLSTHLIKDYLTELDQYRSNKENIFERSKIHQSTYRESSYFENSLQHVNSSRYNLDYQGFVVPNEESKRDWHGHKKCWY